MKSAGIIRSAVYGLCFVCSGSTAVTVSYALDATPAPTTVPVISGPFKNVSEAFRLGMTQYNNGDKSSALKALECAAGHGHAMAEWKVGRMYADGDGVSINKLKAFEHFSKICNDYADETPDSPNARFVANAFVAMGTLYLEGIPNTYVKASAERAREVFAYAATWFGDPDAQYSLGRLTLEGVGGNKDPRQALRWFNLSAEKGHVQSQAMLGHLLFSGQGGMLQRARGLMWLSVAKNAANPERDSWVVTLYDEAMAVAADTDRLAATSYLEQHSKHKK